ncbi:MAG: HAMP domain-containing histidine kinase [Bacteroides sp.]|nr:HAMP domain-containing histidine kinase [Eubacterium sp.]MCM1419331.1 HAMP domain-containing histidine kinase [Roseburia sp.]MCM1462029.1 HAMP domain-containing histidine kinase [Bacteroides sp.]
MHKKSIANRWFVNSFGVVVVLLVILDVAFFFLIRSFYYNEVRQYIEIETNIVAGVLERFYGDTSTDYADEVRVAVEEFEKKNYAELMAINSRGRVFLSSSGFSPEEQYEMPDYTAALASEDGTGYYVGYLESAEKYMAYTVLLKGGGADMAIRIITSLGRIDTQILLITGGIGVASLLLIVLLLVLGMYFIKSIVRPIQSIAGSARRLATGDFSIRIEAERNDELGELCRVFNYMADELENADNVKNEFISSISHELRTPLTAIKGWTETVSGIDDRETRMKGLRIIARETDRLSDMVEELLDFSRMQNGKFTLNPTRIDIIAELSDAVLMYSEKAKTEGIAVIYEESESVAIVNGDKNRLRQVFINILDNAIKYSTSGGTITIETELSEREIFIVISDTGCGISKADLPKVKERFYKANKTVRGSGIGLAVADEIVKMHGGALTLTSEIGKGTSVSIALPLLTSESAGSS